MSKLITKTLALDTALGTVDELVADTLLYKDEITKQATSLVQALIEQTMVSTIRETVKTLARVRGSDIAREYLEKARQFVKDIGGVLSSPKLCDVPKQKVISKPPTKHNQVSKPRAFSDTVRSRVYLEAKGYCANCDKWITIEDYECDHIVPFSKGGETTLDNAQALCKSCNRQKGAN